MGITLHLPSSRTLLAVFGRLCQLVGSIAVAVYYGRILHRAMSQDVYGDARWIFATTVAAISGLSALAYLLFTRSVPPTHKKPSPAHLLLLFAWDCVMTIFWTIVSGIFGSMYLLENPEMDTGIMDMKIAAVFDLVMLVLWGGSASLLGWAVFARKEKVVAKDDKEKGEKKEGGGAGEAKKAEAPKPK